MKKEPWTPLRNYRFAITSVLVELVLAVASLISGFNLEKSSMGAIYLIGLGFVLIFAAVITFFYALNIKRKNKKAIEFEKTKNKLKIKFKKEGPIVKEKLEHLLIKLLKDSTIIIVNKPFEVPQNSNLKSQFGGLPYFEESEKWPESKNGNKLEFLFQIFNEDGIALPENIKLIQFFCDYEAMMCYESEVDPWCIKIYESINKEKIKIIDKPNEHKLFKYCEVKFKKAKSLPNYEDIENYSKEASELLKQFSVHGYGSDDFGMLEEVSKKLTNFEDYNSHLGGYASWIQGPETLEGANWVLLCQINSEDNVNIMWGDDGNIYIFYNRTTKETRLIFQCY